MLSRTDLNSAELETVKISQTPTTAVAANGEVQTKEEATVHVKEFDLFVTVKLLEDTAAVLSLGKSLRRSRMFQRVDQWPADTLPHMKRVSRASRPGLLVGFLRILCNGLCAARRFHTAETDHTCRIGCPDEPDSLTHCNVSPRLQHLSFLPGVPVEPSIWYCGSGLP